MNKLYTLLTLIFITASHSPTTLPMNRFARAVAQKAPRIAFKTTPAFAATPRRLLSATPNLLSHIPSSHEQVNVTPQPNFNGGKQRRNFSRPYPWLPALGAATALGLNWNHEKAECLTIGYAIFHLDEDTILVLINDIHDDCCHSEMALDHRKQVNQLLDYLKGLKGYSVHWIMEYRKFLKQSFIDENASIQRPFLLRKLLNLFDFKAYPTITMNAAIYRAIMNETAAGEMKEGSITYASFDMRNRAAQNYWRTLSNLPIKEQQEFAQKQFEEAQQVIDNANLSSIQKAKMHKIISDYYTIINPSHAKNILREKFYGQNRLGWMECYRLEALASDTKAACIALETMKKEGKKVIVLNCGLWHGQTFTAIQHEFGIHPVQHAGVLYESEYKEFLAKYDRRNHKNNKNLFFPNFSQPLIDYIENQRMTPTEQRFAKIAATMEDGHG